VYNTKILRKENILVKKSADHFPAEKTSKTRIKNIKL
jgi:hypothetical protein